VKRSLFTRLLLSLGGVFILTTLFLGYVLFETTERRFEQTRQTQALTLAKGLAEGSVDALVARDYELLERWLIAATPVSEYAYAYMSRADGTILTHTDLRLVATRGEALGELSEPRILRKTYRQQPVVEVVQPVILADRHIANAHLAYFVGHESILQLNDAYIIAAALLLALFILSTATFIILRRIVRPMTELAGVIDSASMEHTHIDRGMLDRADEVGLLARNFEQLLTRLGHSYRELARQKDQVQITLDSITDSVISTDAQGRIVYMNSIAEIMTGWPLREARGLGVDDIVQLRDAESHEPGKTRVGACLQAGDDYIGSDQMILTARNGQDYIVFESVAALLSPDGDILGAVLVLRDITEIIQISRRLDFQATHDPVTGLINRYEFERRVEYALREAKRSGAMHAICYIDLDQFKIINDTAGHEAGDHVLRQLANRLSQLNLSDSDYDLARLGGDEFAILLKHCALDQAQNDAESILQAIHASTIEWESRRFEPGASIGIVAITPASENVTQVMKEADVACYSAKDEGRDRIFVLDENTREDSMHQRQLLRATTLRDALASERLHLVAQPIVPLGGQDERRHFELLLRMTDLEGKVVSAGPYIPAAEHFGVMQSVDRWVVDAAMRLMKDPRFEIGDALLSINLSGNSLGDDRFLDFVRETMQAHEVHAPQVCFEITETAAVSNLEHARTFIRELRGLGCCFALDDFGSGLSSFMYLKELPVDYLKIDGAFVKEMTTDPIDEAMVAAINEVGHVMGMKTIAEFACSGAIVQRLRALGVDYAQGYALSAPQELVEFLPRRARAEGS
jgi:diguanylate cyclase (GGDEF)-like protein/PAS domain S-box-containing protein